MPRLLIAFLSALLPLAAYSAAPDQVVKDFHGDLLKVMQQGESLGCAGRIKQLQPAVDRTFDLGFISRQVLRKRWSGLQPAQQQQFSAALGELTVLSYASNFTRFSGESFTQENSRDLGRGRLEVPAILRTADGKRVSLNYTLHEKDQGWRVINIIADGVSDLALRSAQYERSFQDAGFDGLMSRLQEQVKTIRAACR